MFKNVIKYPLTVRATVSYHIASTPGCTSATVFRPRYEPI